MSLHAPPYPLPCVLYFCRESFTNQPLFMQNKPNFRKPQMNLSSVKTMNYERITMNNPNRKQTQNKANLLAALINVSSAKTTNYEQITMNNANEKQTQTNPTCSELACPERSRRGRIYFTPSPLRLFQLFAGEVVRRKLCCLRGYLENVSYTVSERATNGHIR